MAPSRNGAVFRCANPGRLSSWSPSDLRRIFSGGLETFTDVAGEHGPTDPRRQHGTSVRSPLGSSAQGPENVESFRPAAAERRRWVARNHLGTMVLRPLWPPSSASCLPPAPGRDRPGWKQTSAAAMAHATVVAHRHVAGAGTPTRAVLRAVTARFYAQRKSAAEHGKRRRSTTDVRTCSPSL
jgi:hypothetical protein